MSLLSIARKRKKAKRPSRLRRHSARNRRAIDRIKHHRHRSGLGTEASAARQTNVPAECPIPRLNEDPFEHCLNSTLKSLKSRVAKRLTEVPLPHRKTLAPAERAEKQKPFFPRQFPLSTSTAARAQIAAPAQHFTMTGREAAGVRPFL